MEIERERDRRPLVDLSFLSGALKCMHVLYNQNYFRCHWHVEVQPQTNRQQAKKKRTNTQMILRWLFRHLY